MSLTPSTIRSAMTGVLAARYPAMTVEAHGGSFTERELPVLLAKAPAVLVACTRISGLHIGEDASLWRADLGMALYVFGVDTATTDRDVLALDTVFDLLTFLPAQRWGLNEARIMEESSITADNLYTGHVNLLRIAVWGVTWTQTFQTLNL